MPPPEPPPRQVDIHKRETLFQGYFRVDRLHLRHSLLHGGMSAPIIREVFERGHSCAVLPYDPVQNCVVLIEQFRAGALSAGINPWLLEIVAGIIEPGETPENVARRELQEEAGLTAHTLIPLGQYLTTPGACSENVHLFCAEVDATALQNRPHGNPEEGEDIRPFALPYAEALRLLDDGKLNNSAAMIGMLWLARHKSQGRLPT